MHGVKKIIKRKQTQFQLMEILETYQYGVCLFLDGKIQSSENDEFIYHEALVHPAMFSHPQPEEVLIIGGGEGATLREVLKHSTLKKVTMVDIDRELVEECKKSLPQWSKGSFENSKVNVIFGEARRFLRKCSQKFDVIILDLTEPLPEGPSKLLFTREFYTIVANHLTPQGVVVVQSGNISYGANYMFTSIVKTLRKVYYQVQPYWCFIPSFECGWGFSLATSYQGFKVCSSGELTQKFKKRGITTLRFYDAITHQGMFSLPKYLREDIERQKNIIRDRKPLLVE
jgi:spermidine synthase